MRLDDADNPLAAEIRQEAALNYFAACRKMVDALEALNTFAREVAPSAQDAERATRRADLIEEAAERVYFVIIQREAMQFSCSEEFFGDYGIPDEVKRRLGPRRRK